MNPKGLTSFGHLCCIHNAMCSHDIHYLALPLLNIQSLKRDNSFVLQRNTLIRLQCHYYILELSEISSFLLSQEEKKIPGIVDYN